MKSLFLYFVSNVFCFQSLNVYFVENQDREELSITWNSIHNDASYLVLVNHDDTYEKFYTKTKQLTYKKLLPEQCYNVNIVELLKTSDRVTRRSGGLL